MIWPKESDTILKISGNLYTEQQLVPLLPSGPGGVPSTTIAEATAAHSIYN
jgi:hypothetical protein